MKGTIKWFDVRKGYGFVTGTDGKEVFLHHSDIIMNDYRYFNEGDIVNYCVVIDDNGRTRAINVKPVLTLSMVVNELSKKGLHLVRIGEDKGVHGWDVVDKSNNSVVDYGMSLIEVATYAGIDTEGLTKEDK